MYTQSWARLAEDRLGVPLRYRTSRQVVGPCPRCFKSGRISRTGKRGGDDRLVVWDVGNYWCSVCHHKGWWVDAIDDAKRAAEEDRVQRFEEAARKRAAMAGVTVWQNYHADTLSSPAHQELWAEHGMTEQDIARWGLGFCKSTPLAPDRPALTIPVFQNGVLVDIRYRLLSGEAGDKYRSHLAGLYPALFNTDNIASAPTVLAVEGEKKAIIISRAGYPAVIGLPGVNFGRSLISHLEQMDGDQELVVALDPKAEALAETLANEYSRFTCPVRVADFPMKPDDFYLKYGGALFNSVIHQARRIQ